MIYVGGSGREDRPGGISIFDDHLNPVGESLPISELLYLDSDPAGHVLYGVSGVEAGLAHAWRISGNTLVSLGAPVPTGGGEPCHLAVDPTGSRLLVANYGGAAGGSVAVLPIGPDGALGAATPFARTTTPGPQPDRQGESHIHQVVFGTENEVLVVDLGADQVVSYLLVDGILTDPVVSSAPPGSGPRHLVSLTGGVAVSGELGSCLLRAVRRGRSLVDWQSTPAAAGRIRSGDRNYPSDLRLARDGARLYVANRGVDSVAVMTAATGALVTEIPCGAWPRHLALAGDRLLVSSTEADEVGVVDLREGRIVRVLEAAAPMCVAVAKSRS